MRILALIATIPARKRSCTRLLAELATRQTRKVDGVILVMDGYGSEPAPACELPIVVESCTTTLKGAGSRWRAALNAAPDDIVICIDDDIMLGDAPRFIEGLADLVGEGGGAAAAMGRSSDGKQAPPQAVRRGRLIYGAGCGLAVRTVHLEGLEALASHVQTAGGFDPLGVLGDDDAFISALLWKNNVPIEHASTGNIYPAPGTHASSQTAKKRNTDPDAQKVALKKITGWPWPQKRVGA